MKKWVIAIGILIACFLLWVALRADRPQIADIKVVDSSGRPVAGAVIRPDGLRPKNGGGHYPWTDAMTVKPKPVTTASSGFASLPYPRYIEEKLETGQISFEVSHPDYCPERTFRTVAFMPPANASLKQKAAFFFRTIIRRERAQPEPVVLRAGGSVRVTGHLNTGGEAVTNIHPLLGDLWLPEKEMWRGQADGAMFTRRVTPGGNTMRLVWPGPGGRIWFSEATNFAAAAGATNEIELELKPGLRLRGKLNDSVPRPVVNGLVELWVFPSNWTRGNAPLIWRTSRKVNADGTFAFESLPPGRAEFIVICDGFVSINGIGTRGIDTQWYPLGVMLESKDEDVTVRMMPAAACRVSVLNDQGRPLAGAKVGFWPNVLWGGWGATIFAAAVLNSENYAPFGTVPDWNALNTTSNRYEGRTDSEGVVVIKNLPPFRPPQDFAVMHVDYELPITGTDTNTSGRRAASVTLTGGGTNEVTVKLQKKGSQYLQPVVRP